MRVASENSIHYRANELQQIPMWLQYKISQNGLFKVKEMINLINQCILN